MGNPELLKPVENVSIYGSRSQEGHVSHICNLIDSLVAAGIKVSVDKKLTGVISESGYRLQLHGAEACSSPAPDSQAVISIGGDGTFLRTARWLAGRELPIMGINTGHLGFLADNSIEETEGLVSMLINGEAEVERRFCLQARCDNLPDKEWPFALNEIAFLKSDSASMITVKVEVDGYYLADYSCDGLIMATPTGSTAYNLSVGGPILAPTLKNIILSPIAPHTLTLRPIVAGGDSKITAVVSGRTSGFRLSIDGRSFPMPCDTPIFISRASHEILTIRRKGQNFASTLRNKLLWGLK